MLVAWAPPIALTSIPHLFPRKDSELHGVVYRLEPHLCVASRLWMEKLNTRKSTRHALLLQRVQKDPCKKNENLQI